MQNRDYLERQLPHGLSDLFFGVAAQRTQFEAMLADTFGRYGYTRIIPPMFEFYESIAAEAGTQLDSGPGGISTMVRSNSEPRVRSPRACRPSSPDPLVPIRP